MKKWLKIVIWVIIIFAVIGITGLIWAKSIWDNITFGSPRLLALNLNGITAADLANIVFAGGEKEVTATLSMDIINKNNFSIPFSSLYVKLFYNNTAIAETSNMLAGDQRIPANGTFTGTDVVKIILNSAGVQMLLDKLKDKKVKLDYKIMVKVFGIPLPKALQTQSFEF